MRKSRVPLIILGILIVILFIFLRAEKNRLNYAVRQRIEELFYSKKEETLCLARDLDGDGLEEEIKFMARRFPGRGRLGEGYIEVLSKGKRIFLAEALGNKLEMANIYDINGDGRNEIVCKWLDGNAINLYVYQLGRKHGQELFSAGGMDVKLADVDGDGIEEIIEYWRDYNKGYDSYVVNIYRWDRKAYVLMKENVPVEIDSQKVDRLILGKGKVVMLTPIIHENCKI